MKTVIIWDACGEDAIKFLVVRGDYSHLDGVYLNSEASAAEEAELNDLVIDEGYIRKMSDDFPLKEFALGSSDIQVIVCGMVP
jgi:hypothetical protein